jgi:hypothetical protein
MATFCSNCNLEYADNDEFCIACGSELAKHAQPEGDASEAAAIAVEQPVEPDIVASREQDAHPHQPRYSEAPVFLGEMEAGNENLLKRIRKRLNDFASGSAGGGAQPKDNAEVNVLPQCEIDLGWRIAGTPTQTKAYLEWSVVRAQDTGEIRAVFRRYTTGALSTRQTYEAVLNAAANPNTGMVRLYSYGTAEVGSGGRADYEITALPSGLPLNVWLKEKGQPGVDPAAYIAPLLANWLKNLRATGLQAIAVHPAMLYLDTHSRCINLAVLGALTPAGAGEQFNADLAGSSALLPAPFAAPELMSRRVIADNADCFSVGQIVAAALFGDAQDYMYISQGNIVFAGIDSLMLRSTVMGTLWPYTDRWSVEQLSQALVPGANFLPKLPPWSSLKPGAAKAAFTLGGTDYFLPEDLLHAVALHWDEAANRCLDILKWLEESRFKGKAGLLRQQLHQEGRSADWILIRLSRIVIPDAPIVWRGYSFDDADAAASLIAIAQQALEPGNHNAQSDLQRLFAADLRGSLSNI